MTRPSTLPRTHRTRILQASMLIAGLLFAGSCIAQPATDADEPTKTSIKTLDEKIEFAENTMRRYGIAKAPEKAAGTFRLTTYNIENLFDDLDDPSLTGRNDDADEMKPEHQRAAVARAIRKLDSDVICMQEIESIDAMIWFRDEYLADMGYEHVISLDAGNSRGIENAVLSRFPLSNPQQWIGKELGGVHPDKYGNNENFYAGEPVAFRRSPLKLDVQIPATKGQDSWTLSLFVLHHKSGRFSQYWREAEARMVAQLAHDIEMENPGRPVVLLGDFNAQTSDESVQTYLRDGFHNIFTQDKVDDPATVTHESGRRIDLILANNSASEYIVEDTAFVLGTAARPEGIDWRSLDSFEGYASDHYPVSVDIKQD